MAGPGVDIPMTLDMTLAMILSDIHFDNLIGLTSAFWTVDNPFASA